MVVSSWHALVGYDSNQKCWYKTNAFNVEFGESIGHKFRIPIFSQYSLRTVVGAWMDLQVRFKTKTCGNAWLQKGEKGEILIVPSPFGNRNVDMSNGWMRTGSHFIKVDKLQQDQKESTNACGFPGLRITCSPWISLHSLKSWTGKDVTSDETTMGDPMFFDCFVHVLSNYLCELRSTMRTWLV